MNCYAPGKWYSIHYDKEETIFTNVHALQSDVSGSGAHYGRTTDQRRDSGISGDRLFYHGAGSGYHADVQKYNDNA